MHTKTPSVTIQGNITANRYRTEVTRSVLLLHIHVKLGMMLARDYASHHKVRSPLASSKQCTKLRWPAKRLDLNPIDHLLDLLKRKVRAQPLQGKLRELSLVIHQMCAAIPQKYIHRHILSTSTRYIVVYVTSGGCTQSIETKVNTTCFDFAVFVLRVSILIV